jgi:hypothetical protein
VKIGGTASARPVTMSDFAGGADMDMVRTRWAAIGAAVAVSLGAGGLGLVHATASSGERAVFVPITPCRLFDTRPGSDNVGPKNFPMLAGETYTFAAHGDNGNCVGIPSDAVSLALNVTAVNATELTFLTIWAADLVRPQASSLNPAPGQPPTPNAVTADLSPDGRFSVYNLTGSVDVLADVVGYYVDHNHDDRYVRLPEGSLNISPTDFFEVNPANNWQFGGFWSHTASGGNECIYAAAHLPVGRTMSRVVMSYISGTGAAVQVLLLALRSTPGPSGGVISPLSPVSVNAPATAAATIGEVSFNLPAGTVVEADRNYTVLVCTNAVFGMLGHRIDLA